MTNSKRFLQAIHKLYTAFHNNSLNPECAKQCAVGNILDQTDTWAHFSDSHGSMRLNYIGLVNQKFGKRFNGYSPCELLEIESTFLKVCGYRLPIHHSNTKPFINKDILFNGLSAVISLLCKFDGISDVMDCSAVLDYKPTTVNLRSSFIQ